MTRDDGFPQLLFAFVGCMVLVTPHSKDDAHPSDVKQYPSSSLNARLRHISEVEFLSWSLHKLLHSMPWPQLPSAHPAQWPGAESERKAKV